jgi:hypothetical protein
MKFKRSSYSKYSIDIQRFYESGDAIVLYMIVPATVALAIGAFFGFNSITFSLAVASVAALSIAHALIITRAWKRSKPARIRALVVIFLSIILIYASIYYVVFKIDTTSFAFSSSITEGKAMEQFSTSFAELADLNEKLYILTILDSDPNIAYQAVSHPNPDVDYQIDNAHRIKSYEYFDLNIAVQTDNVNRMIHVLELYHGTESYKLSETISIDAEGRAINSLFYKDSIESFHSQVRAVISILGKRRSESAVSIHNSVANLPELNLIDFCYFSTVTMTTLGYGDILPNSGTVRFIVMSQGVLGVLFVGFALNVLWPAPKRTN